MKLSKLNVFAIAVLFLLQCSCKDGDDTNPKPDKASQTTLIAQTWWIDQVLINGKADETTDYSKVRFAFDTDGTYTISGNNLTEGSWEFAGNEQKILFDKGTTNEALVPILRLTENQLTLEFTQEGGKSGAVKLEYQLVR